MSIDCSLWPMNLLTKPVGEKDRALIVHPKPAVERKGIRRDKNHRLIITDDKAIKIPTPNIVIPEIKEAGHRHIFCRDRDGSKHCYGRRLNVNKTYTDIYPKIRKMPLPDLPKETVIDFELIWPGHPDSEITTAIKECPEELRMKAFAVPILKGHSYINSSSLDYVQGRKHLIALVGKSNTVTRYTPIALGKGDVKTVLEWLLNRAEEFQHEGYVLKVYHCKDWYKLKGINEADVFVIGFKVSKAKTRMNMVTAVEVALFDQTETVKIGNVSGFNLEEMDKMTAAYNKFGTTTKNPYIHKVLRIIYQELAGQGGLKHAFFDGWRDDKNYTSCSRSQFD